MPTYIYMIIGLLVGILLYPHITRISAAHNTQRFLLAFVLFLSFTLSDIFIEPYYRSETCYIRILLDNPQFFWVEEHYPIQYAHYIHQLQKVLYEDDNDNMPEIVKLDFLNQIYDQAIQTASTKSIYANAIAKVAIYQKLAGSDKAVIPFFEFRGLYVSPHLADYIALLLGNTFKDYLQTKTDVIVSSIKTPSSPLTDQQIQMAAALKANIVQSLQQAYSSTFNGDLYDATLDPNLRVQIHIAFMQKIVSLGPEQAALVLKYEAMKRHS